MTITIKAGNSDATDFISYLNDFDDNFVGEGRGVFSLGISGDYAAGETDITDVADTGSQGFILRGDVQYDLSSHTLSGSISSIDFGYGLTATDAGGELDIEATQLDFTISFDTPVTGDDANDLIYSMLELLGPDVDATDEIRELLESEDILFLGNGGDDVFSGYDHDDKLKGKNGNDTLNGGKGDDKILGGNGQDDLAGNDGDDRIFGESGADDLRGNDGDDVIKGGSGKDTIEGGQGKDKLTGEDGNDVFVFKDGFDKDIVVDFDPGTDLLDLSALTSEASSFEDFLNASSESGTKVVYDLDNDGENRIVLKNTTLDELSSDDFLF